MNSQGQGNTLGSGLGSQLFGGSISNAFEPSRIQEEVEVNVDDNAEDAEDTDDEGLNTEASSSSSELVTALAAITLPDSPWKASPVHLPSQYLSTVSEYLPPTPKEAVSKGVQMQDSFENDDDKKKDVTWAFEGYENSLEVDQVFERFLKRVQCEGSQCLR